MDDIKYRTDMKKDQLELLRQKKLEEQQAKLAEFMKERNKLQSAPTKSDNYYNVLNQDKQIVSGGTDKINKSEAIKQTPIEDFQLQQRYRDAAKDIELETAAKKAGQKVEVLDYKKMKKEMAQKLAKQLGSKALKAIPIIGAGASIMSSIEAANAGDYETAALEALSAVDPTPLTDTYLAGRDIYRLKALKDKRGY
jgi:hypothetical protein